MENNNLNVDSIANEIKANFNPKEKAYLEVSLVENIVGSIHNERVRDIANYSGITHAEKNRVDKFISNLEDKHFSSVPAGSGPLDFDEHNEKYIDIIDAVLKNLEKDDEFRKEVNPIFRLVAETRNDIKNEKIYNRIAEASKHSNEGYSPLETYQNLKNTAEKLGLQVVLKNEAHSKLDDNEKADVYLAYYKNQEKLPIETGITLGDGKAKTFLERINPQTNEMTFEAEASKSYTAEKQWQADALKSVVQKYNQNIKMETQQENVQNFIVKMVFSDHGKTQTELDKERLQEYKNLTPEEKNMVKEMGVREAINLIEEVGEKTISQEGIKKTQEHFERIINEAEKEQTTKQSSSQNENIYNDKQKQEEKIKSPIESVQLDYLKNQLKYLGFGESNKLHQDLEKGVNSNEKTFKIHTQSDRAMQGNEVNFTLNFNKSEKGGVFLNSFNATLKNEIGEVRTHNFGVNHFTAKEAVNLLEGRSVKTEFKENEPVFVKLNFAEEKNEYGNFKFQTYNQQAYGVDTAKIVEKSGLIFDKPEHKDNAVKSLEKGNIVKVKFNLDNKITEGNAVLNPQYKTLNLYDKEMNRLNTNKPIQGLDTQQQEKNNIRQQNISRSL